ncbi:MAG: BlaI/MecI/CopY family transcriptional regulator, partial [Lachnospiraceae bacterium]|nr:BlaI/MecI/CopY family transcriptional regulator [Lachnospiraceae bacterium]
LWENEPIASPQLVKLCNDKLGWKKSTPYTVIKKLSDKGIVKNENTIVSSLVDKTEVDRQESEELLQRTSHGHLPTFLAAFLKDRKLSKEEADRIRKLIDDAQEE